VTGTHETVGWQGMRVLAAAVGMGVALAVASGCASDAEKRDEYLAEAEAKREAGEEREALLLLRQALRLDPTNASLNLQIAQLLEEMGHSGDAAFFYGEAYRIDPSLSEAALARAPLLYGSESEEARELVNQVLERDPDNHMAYYRKAEIDLLGADREEALAAALTAVELAPEAPESHRIVGTVYATMERAHRAETQEPDEALLQKALDAFRRAADLEPAWYHWNDIGNVHGRWPGHAEEAKEAWRRAFAAAREAESEEGMRSVEIRALAWGQRRGDMDFVRWALERRLERDPGQVSAWRQLAQVADAQEEGAGEAVWQRALEERREDPLVHAAYANRLGRVEGPAAAAAYVESLPAELREVPELALLQVTAYTNDDRLERAREVVAGLRERQPGAALTRFAEARIAVAEGRLDDAAKGLREIATELERPDVFRLLAQVELGRGQPGGALEAVDRAIELNSGPGRLQLYRLRHRSQIALGDWEALVSSLRRMRREGLAVGTLERLQFVEASYALGDPSRGRRVLERLLEGDSPSPGIVRAFARYEGRRQPERARELLEEAIEAHGAHPLLVRTLARLELGRGRPEDALHALDQAGPPESVGPPLRLLRARALAALERWGEAEAEARAVSEREEGAAPGAARLLAQILQAQGRQEAAIEALERARSEGEAPPRSLWLLGRMYMQQEDFAKAREVLEEAVDAGPNLHVAHNDLAYVLAETKQELDRALALVSQARSALPESAAVADTLGWVYYRRGMLEPAVAAFRSALELAGEGAGEDLLAGIHYRLALALREQGQGARALEQVERALELQPEHPEALEMRRKLATTLSSSGAGG